MKEREGGRDERNREGGGGGGNRDEREREGREEGGEQGEGQMQIQQRMQQMSTQEQQQQKQQHQNPRNQQPHLKRNPTWDHGEVTGTDLSPSRVTRKGDTSSGFFVETVALTDGDSGNDESLLVLLYGDGGVAYDAARRALKAVRDGGGWGEIRRVEREVRKAAFNQDDGGGGRLLRKDTLRILGIAAGSARGKEERGRRGELRGRMVRGN